MRQAQDIRSRHIGALRRVAWVFPPTSGKHARAMLRTCGALRLRVAASLSGSSLRAAHGRRKALSSRKLRPTANMPLPVSVFLTIFRR